MIAMLQTPRSQSACFVGMRLNHYAPGSSSTYRYHVIVQSRKSSRKLEKFVERDSEVHVSCMANHQAQDKATTSFPSKLKPLAPGPLVTWHVTLSVISLMGAKLFNRLVPITLHATLLSTLQPPLRRRPRS